MDFKIVTYLYLVLIAGAWSKNVRIMGGELSNILECPYLVSIRIADSNKHICAGSIISHKDILTAGHCFYKKERYYSRLKVYAGSSTLSGESKSIFSIESFHVHPGFNGKIQATGEFHNDMAIIKVKEFIHFNAFQHKIELPTHDILQDSLLVLYGWGTKHEKLTEFSDNVLKATVKVIKHSDCIKKFKFSILDDQICTYREGIGTCDGDSGGPLVRNGKIIGIVSFSLLSSPEKPDVQINVFTHLIYIRSIIDKTL